MNVRLLRQCSLILFLLLLLGIPVVQLVWPVTETNENRLLAPFPGWPSEIADWQRYPKAFDEYMDDNFGFRRALQRSFHRLIVATGTSPVDDILLGSDGWLFTTHMNLTSQNRGAMELGVSTLNEYVDAFRTQRRWVEARGVRHFVMPIPDKNTLYPEYLPEWARPVRPGRFAQLQAAMEDASEPVIDSLSALSAAKGRGEWIYWQTDAHWNCLGAFHAYQSLMDAVQASETKFRKRISPEKLSVEVRPPSKGGDLSQMLIMEDILLENRDVGCGLVLQQHVPFTAERLSDGLTRKNYVAAPRHEIWRYRQHVPVIESRVLVYRDSFAYLLLPYLIKSFDELVVVPHGDLGFEERHVFEHEPDVVIYQFVERDLIHQPNRDHLEDL